GILVPILGSLALNANPVFAIVVFIASVIFIDRSVYNRKIKRALEVYEYGDEITIYLESEGENYGMRLNGRPQRVINIRKGNETIAIKTFSYTVISAFSYPVQKAYVYSKYP